MTAHISSSPVFRSRENEEQRLNARIVSVIRAKDQKANHSARGLLGNQQIKGNR